MPAEFSARDLTIELVNAASVTHSPGEVAFPDTLLNILGRLPYFQANPHDLWTEQIDNDPFGRRNVYALVRGTSPHTVVLTGHYDVVPVSNYGPHADVAFDPEALLPRLIADLRVNARSEAEHRALHDLESGDFLPGRGVLDMKSGLAAGMVALAEFARQKQRSGNLLFLAVADEEVSSHGARWAAPALTNRAEREGWALRLVINLDATGDNGDGSEGQAVYIGTVGKLLVSAFVVGVDTHAGYALDGVNVNFLTSALARAFECNPALTDHSDGVTGTPPTILKQQDLKTVYDVTTPARAWLCVNALTHGMEAQMVLENFTAVARAALGEALQTLRDRAEALGNHQSAAHGATPLVLTSAQLLDQARTNTPDFDEAYARFERTLDPHLDYPSRSAHLTAWLWDASGLLGPAAVLGFASLHYPNTTLRTGEPGVAATFDLVRKTLREEEGRLGIHIAERAVFTGISDMSWFGQTDPADIQFVNANTPLAAAQIHAPPAGLPCINLGPWGRDYHQWLERAYAPYSFITLPHLVSRLAEAFLK
ncbi:M20/M25/M40 family metallo-hydrolase (plasmid) [Deinococcus psychrotolerans]|uniref:M20/M25/M40 family metallo-hydrolase n=1 Tax=Deinococcus psychrotolerans TaxID=2489213 RepID=A0A3G8YQH8_9DEIO|nr:M20/M25/M40 family metallo-hydrolase [Deinococcus psychrotolerans]AZI44844.1 M20/M25/M40 family metallo-hydrolase [Deinococcus psychrotolerans]